MDKISLTCTTIFLVPQLPIESEHIRSKVIGFVNAYLKDEQFENNYENAIFLLFKPSDLTEFAEFVRLQRETTSLLIDEYDYDDGFTVLVYALPEGLEKDMKIFMSGKYSRFSEKFKKAFPQELLRNDPKTGRQKRVTNLGWGIINRSPDIKEFWEKELDHIFGPDDEIWIAPTDLNGKINKKEILNIGVAPLRGRHLV